MNNRVEILKVNKLFRGAVPQKTIWYDYQVCKEGKIISSFIKADKKIEIEKLHLLIQQQVEKIGVDNFVSVSHFSPFIIKKIHEMLLSDNELFFIQQEEIDSLSEEERLKIRKDIDKYDLHDKLSFVNKHKLIISKSILERCHFDDEKIILLNVENQGQTDLVENSQWYYYVALKGNQTLNSYLIINNDCTIKETKDKILYHINKKGFDQFVDISLLHDFLQDIIYECNYSENEMYFIEYNDDEYLAMDSQTKETLVKEVEKYGLQNYIEFNTVDAAITVYGGISEVINFKL